MTTYLIIGNGVAGLTAAETIRKIDPEGKILIFSKEKIPFSYVPALPEYLAGERQVKDVVIHHQPWYEENRLDLHLVTEIAGIYFVPPIKGAQADGVFTLRTIGDAAAIKERAKKSRKLVLIGGGLLGLEAGNGLRKLGLNVTVVEFFPRLLPRQMDVPGGAILQKQMEQMGFRFNLGATTKEILPENGHLVVCLESGERLNADLVLISAGVRPELTLAKSLGLAVDKGVKVDDAMKTELDDIYAAGDLIEHRGRFYGIWPAAQEQGRVAGAVMAGQDLKYEGTVPANSLKVVGIDLVAAGEIDPEGKLESVIVKDEAKYLYRKLVIQDNAIIGAILLGDIRGSEEIQQAIKNHTNISASKSFR